MDKNTQENVTTEENGPIHTRDSQEDNDRSAVVVTEGRRCHEAGEFS